MTLEFSISRRAAHELPAELAAVYILMLHGRPMYVGQTCDLRTRIVGHRNTSRSGYRERLGMAFDFDRIEWHPVARFSDRLAYEGALARALNPAFTFRVSHKTRRDRRILRSLGIIEYRANEFNKRVDEHKRSSREHMRLVLNEWDVRDRVERVFAFIEAA